eukprot:888422-Rhodomonas_salina.1
MQSGHPKARPERAPTHPPEAGFPVRDHARSATPGHDWWVWSSEGHSCTLEVPLDRDPPPFVFLCSNKWKIACHPQASKLPEAHPASGTPILPPSGPHHWGVMEGKRQRASTDWYGRWSGQCTLNAEHCQECSAGCAINTPLSSLPAPTGLLVWKGQLGWGL